MSNIFENIGKDVGKIIDNVGKDVGNFFDDVGKFFDNLWNETLKLLGYGQFEEMVKKEQQHSQKENENKSGPETEAKQEAKRTILIEKLVASLRNAQGKLKEHQSFEEVLLAMFAVGLSAGASSSDGGFSEDFLYELKHTISGLSYKALPKTTRESIERMIDNPPTFNEALIYVHNTDNEDWTVYDNIIELVVLMKNEDTNVRVFRQAWYQYKAS